ncbi:MAG: acyltransferase family protein [Rubripirellula sp.]
MNQPQTSPTDSDSIAASVPESPSKPARLLSLDTFRGLIMCSLAINGLAFAATAKRLGYGPDVEVTTFTGRVWQLLAFHNSHPFWNSQFWVIGCSYWDLIQPSFMFMVGVSMPYSFASRRKQGHSRLKLSSHALIRALVLIALGVFLQTRNSGLDSNRLLTNVLSQIGLGYFFVYLLLGRSFRLHVLTAVIVLAGYWVWFIQHPTPDPLPPAAAESIVGLSVPDSVAARFALNVDPATELDVKLFNSLPHGKEIGAHPAGYVTLNFIPSAITMLFGVMAGTLLRSERDDRQKVLQLVAAGAVCMTIAVLLSYTVCPVVKKIWTPAWTLYSGAWVVWILAGLYWIIDVRGWKKWTLPLVIVGMNSLAMYLMGSLLKGWVSERLQVYLGDEWLRAWLSQSWNLELSKNLFAGPYGATIQAAMVFGVFWLACLYLYRNKMFFRI